MTKRPDLSARNSARRIDLSGGVFGRLKAIEPGGSDRWGAALWRCGCACGQETLVKTSSLRRGSVTSCGCAQNERRRTWNRSHGGSNTRLYRIWQGMITRTTNPKASHFAYYGGRGIRVCDEWQSFDAFREWSLANGYSDDLSIDRYPDNNGNYEPSNCRWATQSMQVRNRRSRAELTQQQGDSK